MRHGLAWILVVLFAAAANLFGQEAESRTIQVSVGDTVTLPLEPALGIWEERVITPDLITIESKRQLEERVELVLSMNKAGTGRLEAVRILTNRVIDRKYFFFQIEEKKSEEPRTPAAQTQSGGTKAESGKKDSAEQQELEFALRVYEDGAFEESLQAFALFRAKYPASAELARLSLYEGQALYGLRRYAEALDKFAPAAQQGEDDQLWALAQLWIGNAADAQGKTDDAIVAYMSAFNPAYPEIDIQARTALAAAYGRKGRAGLADEQFKRIFRLYADTRDQNAGYLPALFHAASFYDYGELDAELAVTYYQEFITLAGALAGRADTSGVQRRQLRAQIADARKRLQYLRDTFTNYR
jgi:TolA-binding protein